MRNYEDLCNNKVPKNMLMQLRKVCCHPYMFEGAEPIHKQNDSNLDHLINDSEKLRVLDMLLQKLYRDGHKVLLLKQHV